MKCITNIERKSVDYRIFRFVRMVPAVSKGANMKLILSYLRRYKWQVAWSVTIKFFGSMGELFIPFLLKYMVDDIAPTKDAGSVILFGCAMVLCAVLVLLFNVKANQRASAVAKMCTRDLRHDLFSVTTNLTGSQFDGVTLPSLISRMTADSYNVQNFIGMIQRMGIRAPILLIGGVILAAILDPKLSLVLLCMVPLMACVVLFVSRHGIPLYNVVQENVDRVTRILRENITGIRVVKALSREEYETERYDEANEALAKSDFRAGATMAESGGARDHGRPCDPVRRLPRQQRRYHVRCYHHFPCLLQHYSRCRARPQPYLHHVYEGRCFRQPYCPRSGARREPSRDHFLRTR